MLFTSVIIVLREVLEAALLAGILLAVTRLRGQGIRWLGWGGFAGLLGAALYSGQYREISDWFDGMGYEAVNAALQVGVYGFILAVIWRLGRYPAKARSGLVWYTGLTVGLAITREGAELVLYFSGFQRGSAVLPEVLFGSVIGAGVGFSVGALLYYLLLSVRTTVRQPLILGLLVLLGAGLCSQATTLLIQADWLPAREPVWNSGSWLPESSVIGQLLFAMVGYEATPSLLQVLLYLASLGVAAATACFAARAGRVNKG